MTHEQLRDYIVRITEEIWEGRNLDKIAEYYKKNIVIHTPLGDLKGADKAIDNTAEVLHSFPDRQLLPHEIIVSENKRKMHSSHRIISVMHARGASAGRKAGNQPVRVYTIADCAVEDGQIYEEWLVRDHLAIVLQTGMDPMEFAAAQASKVAYFDTKNLPAFLRPPKKKGAYKQIPLIKFKSPSKRNEFSNPNLSADAEKTLHAYADLFRQVFTGSRFAEIPKMYHRACSLFLPGGVCDYGREAADAFFMGYAASFTEKKFEVHHLAANEEPGLPLRVSMRWVLSGKHSGNGRFGAASGADVVILGISHANFYEGKIIAEWNLIDEIAILAQIEAFKRLTASRR